MKYRYARVPVEFMSQAEMSKIFGSEFIFATFLSEGINDLSEEAVEKYLNSNTLFRGKLRAIIMYNRFGFYFRMCNSIDEFTSIYRKELDLPRYAYFNMEGVNNIEYMNSEQLRKMQGKLYRRKDGAIRPLLNINVMNRDTPFKFDDGYFNFIEEVCMEDISSDEK